VRAARALRHTKQWLLVALLLVVASLVVVYAIAVMGRATANAELVNSQAETASLRAEEQKYAAVQPLITGITHAEDARRTVMAPEIQWKQYLDAIAAVLPANVSITSFAVTQGSTTSPAPAAPDALTTQGVATIMFTARAVTLPDSAAWSDSLNGIPGFYSAFTSSESIGEKDSVVAYEVTSMVQVNDSALLGRFAVAPDAAATGDVAATAQKKD